MEHFFKTLIADPINKLVEKKVRSKHSVQNRAILSRGIIKVPPRAISQKVVKLGIRQLGAALIRFT